MLRGKGQLSCYKAEKTQISLLLTHFILATEGASRLWGGGGRLRKLNFKPDGGQEQQYFPAIWEPDSFLWKAELHIFCPWAPLSPCQPWHLSAEQVRWLHCRWGGHPCPVAPLGKGQGCQQGVTAAGEPSTDTPEGQQGTGISIKSSRGRQLQSASL